MSEEFGIDFWRASRDARRALARELILKAVVSDRPLVTVGRDLDQLKRNQRYSLMDTKDQAVFRRFCSDVSQLVDLWPWVPEEKQMLFKNATLAYSGALKAAKGAYE